MRTQFSEIENLIDSAKEMIAGNVRIEVERVEQARFAATLASHHHGLADERSHPSIATESPSSRCFSTESARSGHPTRSPIAVLPPAIGPARNRTTTGCNG